MSAERTLLRRLVEAVAHYTDDHLRRAGGAGIPHDYLLGQTMADARALLAEPEGEKSSGCPRRQSPQTPCVLEVGPMDADEEGICVGCGMPWEGAVRQQERPTPRSRAEAEAMVERFASALGLHVDHWLGPTETQRTEIADARAALLAALTGEEK